MPDEPKDVSASSTEPAASAAPGWEEITGSDGAPVVEEKPKTEEVTTTQAEKVDENHPSKLGRKFEALSEKFDALMGKMDSFVSQKEIKPENGKITGNVSDRYSEDIYDQMIQIEPCPVEYVTTPKEQVQVGQWERRVMKRMEDGQRSTYQSAYLGAIKDFAGDGGELHAQISAMITGDDRFFNVVRTGNGKVDAELNYHRAHTALLSGKAKPKSFGKGESPAGSGVTIPDRSDVTPGPAVKLDPLAASYADYLGMNQEQRDEAMKRPIAGSAVK